jgi:hypothetical protein
MARTATQPWAARQRADCQKISRRPPSARPALFTAQPKHHNPPLPDAAVLFPDFHFTFHTGGSNADFWFIQQKKTIDFNGTERALGRRDLSAPLQLRSVLPAAAAQSCCGARGHACRAPRRRSAAAARDRRWVPGLAAGVQDCRRRVRPLLDRGGDEGRRGCIVPGPLLPAAAALGRVVRRTRGDYLPTAAGRHRQL